MLLSLVWSNFIARKTRLALTVAAVALSVSLVVAVTGGFASMDRVANRFLSSVMGTADATVSRQNETRAGVDEKLIDQISADPDVRHATGRLETGSFLLDKKGNPVQNLRVQLTGVKMPGDREVDRLQMNGGKWFQTDDGNYTVVDQVLRDTFSFKLGDTITIPGVRGNATLKITGFVQKPGILASQIQTAYLPLKTLQNLYMPDMPGRVGKILIDLKPGTSGPAFAARWQTKLTAIDPSLKIKLTSSYRDEVARYLQGLQLLSYLGGMVSMLSATFIVFSALSMGVTERQRTLAMLRAVGAVKTQVARLVLYEGLLIGGLGVLIGVPVGWLALVGFFHLPRFAPIFAQTGIVLSPGGLWLACGGSLVAAVLASVLPAWSATRVDPLEAMRPLASGNPGRLPIVAIFFGVLLILVDPLIMFGPLIGWIVGDGDNLLAHWLQSTDPEVLSKTVRIAMHFLVGLPTLFFGFFLIAPLFVWLTDRLLAPVVAVLMGMRPALLRQQMSSGIWRAAGTSAALMVGLAVLISMQVQGHTALNAWKLPDHFPDVFIFSPTPLTPADQAKLATVKGIKPKELMPIAIASPQFGSNLFAIAGAMVMPDATMFFGIDPDKGLQMMELEFRNDQGQRVSQAEQDKMRDDAIAQLKLGRHVIVTDEFRQLKGLKRGDKLALQTVNHGTQDYIIAGVVWSPGMDVINSHFDLGAQFEQRTAASVFGTLADAANDFNVHDYYLFAANLDYFTERDKVLDDVQATLGKMNMRIGDVRQIKKGMQDGLKNLLLIVSSVAFSALAVASLGVTNTILASVRSRQWQFGILRSIGVTRSQLLRLVVAEAALLGLVGAALGTAAGLVLSIEAKRLTIITLGLNAPMVIPWDIVALGAGIVVLVAIVASIVPAVRAGRSDPLDLLQAGRSAA